MALPSNENTDDQGQPLSQVTPSSHELLGSTGSSDPRAVSFGQRSPTCGAWQTHSPSTATEGGRTLSIQIKLETKVLFNQSLNSPPVLQAGCRAAEGDQSSAGMKAGCDVKEDTPVGLLEGNLDLHNYDLIPHPVTLKGPTQMEAAWFLATESTAM